MTSTVAFACATGRRRAARCVAPARRIPPILRQSDLGPIGDLLMDLHEWIALFDPRSLVELDYGGLCDFLTWDELDDDQDVRGILGLALEALRGHESPRSAETSARACSPTGRRSGDTSS